GERVGAPARAERELLGASGRGDQARAEQLPELDRRHPERAGRAQDQERLAALELTAVLEPVPAGPVGVEQNPRLGKAHRVVEPARGVDAYFRALGEPADQAECACDAIADG